MDLNKDFPQTFNGQLFFVNTPGLTDFQNFLQGSPAASFGGGGVYNHQYRANDFGLFALDDWKATRNLTLNLGMRVEINGAFHDNLCHIGNIDESLAAAGSYPMIYGACANSLGVPGLTGSGNNTTYKNNYATGLAPRIGLAYDLAGDGKTSIRAGYGIYYVREDVGSVDQLSFQAPFLSDYVWRRIAGMPRNVLLRECAGELHPCRIYLQPERASDGGDAEREFHTVHFGTAWFQR